MPRHGIAAVAIRSGVLAWGEQKHKAVEEAMLALTERQHNVLSVVAL
jgi:hypothetical protein